MKTYHCNPPKNSTFDVVFHNDNNSNSKGFRLTFNKALEYLNSADRTSSYWPDYKGGVVQIVCNESGQTIYTEFI